MNTQVIEQKPETAPPAIRAAREIRVVEDDGPLSFMMDTAKFEHLQRLSRMMAIASLTPAHLVMTYKGDNGELIRDVEGTLANCFRIVNQAMRWGVDPFALAEESYVAKGKVGYSGKLVAAILQKHAPMSQRLKPTYSGEGKDLVCTVTGKLKGEDFERTADLTLKQAETQTCDYWRKDPKQKLWYSTVTKWARLHCPEVLLGIMTEEDLEQIVEETPAPPITLNSLLSPKLAEKTDDIVTEPEQV